MKDICLTSIPFSNVLLVLNCQISGKHLLKCPIENSRPIVLNPNFTAKSLCFKEVYSTFK